jgi:uncharacterized membrane protein YoaK (UPF0700 family)
MNDADRTPHPLIVSLGALTVVSGIVDAVSFLGLGHVFTANMTGNVVLVGFAAAGAPGFSVAASLTALGSFSIGSVVGGRLIQRLSPQRALLLATMAFEAGFTAAAAVLAASVTAIGSGWPRYVLIAGLALSMGIRNAAVRHLGVRDMATTVVTTTLTDLASNSALAGGHNPNSVNGITSLLTMFVGALIGAVLVLHASAAWALGLAAAIVACIFGYFTRRTPLELGLTAGR